MAKNVAAVDEAGPGIEQTEPGALPTEDEQRIAELLAQAADLEAENIDLGKRQEHADTTVGEVRKLREQRLKINGERDKCYAQAAAIRKAAGLSPAERAALKAELGKG